MAAVSPDFSFISSIQEVYSSVSLMLTTCPSSFMSTVSALWDPVSIKGHHALLRRPPHYCLAVTTVLIWCDESEYGSQIFTNARLVLKCLSWDVRIWGRGKESKWYLHRSHLVTTSIKQFWWMALRAKSRIRVGWPMGHKKNILDFLFVCLSYLYNSQSF